MPFIFCLAVLLCLPAARAQTVWKVHGQSRYGDEPPGLRLHNVQKFDPRTGKLSAVINEKPRLPVKAPPEPPPPPAYFADAAQGIALLPENASAAAAAPVEEEPVSAAEQQRRDMCQAAQDAWQKAAAAQSSEAAQYEAEVVRHCIAA